MNTSQTQTAWVLLIFLMILGGFALGAVGISSAETLGVAQETVSSAEPREVRSDFLVWGAMGAFIAAIAMRWVRSSPSDAPKPRRASGY